MSLFHCRFCDHDNPSGARFCNACGSPLYLKPCPQCEAVNASTASQCYQCGAALPKEDATEEASIASMPEFVGATDNAATTERGVPAGAFAERFEVEFGEFRPSLFSDKPPAAEALEEAGAGARAIGDLRQARASPTAAHHGV